MNSSTLTTRGAYYVGDGERFVRVTSVCAVLNKPHLAIWRGKVGNAEADRIAAEAAAFGTRVHEAAYAYLAQRDTLDAAEWLEAQPDDVRPFLAALTGWLAANVAAVVGAERLLISRRYGFAGTTDLVCSLTDGDLAIVDWKTSKAFPREASKPDPSWRIQTAAYQAALEEQDGLHAPRRLVVQVPSDNPGALHVHEFPRESIAADWLSFKAALHLYRWQGEAKTNGAR